MFSLGFLKFLSFFRKNLSFLRGFWELLRGAWHGLVIFGKLCEGFSKYLVGARRGLGGSARYSLSSYEFVVPCGVVRVVLPGWLHFQRSCPFFGLGFEAGRGFWRGLWKWPGRLFPRVAAGRGLLCRASRAMCGLVGALRGFGGALAQL